MVSFGYVGSLRSMPNCIDSGKCLRIELGISSGQRYELCRSVHAEQNAIINAARSRINIINGVMYIGSERINIGYHRKDQRKIYGPCIICKKEIINVGIRAVHMREEGIGTQSYKFKDLKINLKKEEEGIVKHLKKKPKRILEL